MRRTLLAALTILFVHSAAGALTDDQWKFFAQIRHRVELNDRDFNDDTSPFQFSLLRTRLGVELKPEKNLKAFIQIQDTRIFGESPFTVSNLRNVDLHQGYLDIIDIFTWPVNVKLGRFEKNYGPQRLIGALDWANTGRSFDGAIVNIHGEKAALDLFSFTTRDSLREQLRDGVRPTDNGDRYLLGAWGEYFHWESYVSQLFLLWQLEKPKTRLNRRTIGFYFKKKSGRFRHETEFAYQGGSITLPTTTTELSVEALMAALNVGYNFPNAWSKPDIWVGVDYLSGDDNLEDDRYKVFDTLFGTNHKYYGYMDYFLNIPINTFGRGLVDSHIQLDGFWGNFRARLKYHHFASAADYTLDSGSTTRTFGDEVDLVFSYTYRKYLQFQGAGTFFVPGEIFKEKRGSDTSTWFYLMTNLKF